MAIFQATDIVEMALELEKSGEVFYRRAAEKVDSDQVRTLFQELADEEQDHYAAFQKLSSATSWDQASVPEMEWDQYMNYLQATIQSAFFEGSEKALALAEEVSDSREALQMAMGFEKETMLFFHDLHDKVSGPDKEIVESIIAEEKKHLHRLANMI
jgi:rubrerythrin